MTPRERELITAFDPDKIEVLLARTDAVLFLEDHAIVALCPDLGVSEDEFWSRSAALRDARVKLFDVRHDRQCSAAEVVEAQTAERVVSTEFVTWIQRRLK